MININGKINNSCIIGGVKGGSSITIKDGAGNVMISFHGVSGDVRQESSRVVTVGSQRFECGSDIASIVIGGDVDTIKQVSKIEVTGNVGSISTQSGDVNVHGNVNGSISTLSGDVDVKGSVGGTVNTMSGDINIENQEKG